MQIHRKEEKEIQKALGKFPIVLLGGPKGVGKTYLALQVSEAWKKEGNKASYMAVEAIGLKTTVPEGEYQTPVWREVFNPLPLDKSAAALADLLQSFPEKSLVIIDEIDSIIGWEDVVEKKSKEGKLRFIIISSSGSFPSGKAKSWIGKFAVHKILEPLKKI